MKRGIDKDRKNPRRSVPTALLLRIVLVVGLFSSAAHAEEASIHPDERAAALQKEAYYHFFLEDYLTSATRLKLIEETPGNSEKVMNDTRLLLGGLYIAWGMYRPATSLFNRWVENYPEGSSRNELLLLIERLQYRRALYQAAINTFGLLKPDQTFSSMDQARYLSGMSQYILGSVQNGIGDLQAIPASSGYFPFAQMGIAQSYARLEDFEKSISILKNLGAMDSQGDSVRKALAEKSRLVLGFLLMELGRPQEARPVFRSIPVTSPFYPDALFGEGWADFNAGRYPEALPSFQELSQVFPDHPYALEGLITIGGSYQRLGALAKSLQSYGEALEAYGRKEREIREFRTLIQNRDQLADWLGQSRGDQEDRLGLLLEDDLLRFRVGQYRELSSLLAYLDRTLADMGVFKIMVDHREEVYRGHLPTLRGFLDENPVKPLRDQEQALKVRLEEAVKTEGVRSLATNREREELDQLNRARSQAGALRKKIEQSNSSSPQILELKEQLETASRRLDLLRGEVLWSVITQAPGRIDDLQRNTEKLGEELDALTVRQERLKASIPSLQGRIDQFRQRIDRAGQTLQEQKKTALDLRARLLPPLQAMFLDALDRKRGRIERLAATARLSQIQILDLKSRP